MKTQITRLSAWLALFVALGCVVCPAYVRADATGPGLASQSMAVWARVTENTKPLVQKAVPADPSKDELAPFVPCRQGDILSEGTMVQTGNAPALLEMKWSNGITNRLWSNSMARICPNARWVFLSSGVLVFHKPRPLDGVYTVETKRLQARIRGTTVRVKVTPACDLIEVLECQLSKHPVEVTNKLNGSIIKLTPGVVLEVRGVINKSMLPDQQQQPIAYNCQTDPRLDPRKGEVIFTDDYSTTVAFTANAKAILDDPLIKGGNDIAPIDSIELIRTAMRTVPSSENTVGNFIETALNFGKPDKLIAENLIVARAPNCSYMTGPNVGWVAPDMPGIVSEFLPGAIKLPRGSAKPVCSIGKEKYRNSSISSRMPVVNVMIPGIPIVPPASSEQDPDQGPAAINPDRHTATALDPSEISDLTVEQQVNLSAKSN